MKSECSLNEQRIPRSLAGDLSVEEQHLLDAHLAACPSCRAEHARYIESLSMLQSVGEEPIPRHFFVYPKEPASNLWDFFRLLKPHWQIVGAGAACLLLFLSMAAVSGLQVRRDNGAWGISFGSGHGLTASEMASLKAEILRSVEDRNREIALGYIQIMRSEIAGSRADLSQQQIQLAAALDRLEIRLNTRLDTTAEEIRAGSQNSAASLYQTLSLQRNQDMNAVNTRFDRVVDNVENRARQTDEILETLLQIANLNLKQPGEQK